MEQKILNNYHFSNQTYFVGFFANFNFFYTFRDDLLDEFTLKITLSKENKEVRRRILHTRNATFLHVRRGDFLQDKHWEYIKLGKAYYEGGIKSIKSTT